MDDKENQDMLDSLSQQHQQLLHLQACQKMLLNTQREFSMLGLTAEAEIGKKYNILQSVKHKITQLENMAQSPKENKLVVRYSKEQAPKRSNVQESGDSVESMKGQLSDLHGLVSTLLTEVDDMIGQNDSLQESSKSHDENIELVNRHGASLLSPLPEVNLVDRMDRSARIDLSGSYDAESFGNVERHIATPDKSPDVSFDPGDSYLDKGQPNSVESKPLFSDSTQFSFLSETERSDHYNYSALDDMLCELNNAVMVLRSLLVDQKSLRSLLRNSMTRSSDFLDGSYGISSDFIQYQLDSCTQHVSIAQNHVEMLQKQFAELKLNAYPLSPTGSDAKWARMKNEDKVSAKLDETAETDLENSQDFRDEENGFLYPVYTYSVVSNKEVRSAFPPSDAEMPLLQIRKVFYECYNQEDQDYLDMISQNNLEEVLNSVGITLSAYLEFICESESRMSYHTLMSTFPFLKDRFAKAQTSEAEKKKLEEKVSFFDEIVTENDSPQKSDPLFESLREDIYSQAAGLILQNESRPHFLMELFHELKQLNSDYLRQHCLYVLRDTIRGYLQHSGNEASTSNLNLGQLSFQKRQRFLDENSELFTENTPSECDASDLDTVEEDVPFVSQMSRSHPHHLHCDYALDVSNGTDLSTPHELSSVANDDEENPFEADYLGSTVLHLDEALQRVREIEKEEQDKIDAPLLRRIQEVVYEDKGKEVGSSSKEEDTVLRSEKNNIKFLDAFVKRIMSKMVTKHILNSPEYHLSRENALGMVQTLLELISQEKMMDYIDYIHLKTSKFKDANMFHKISQYFVKELSSEIEKCLTNEFIEQSFSECGEKIVVKLADILYHQFSFYCLEGDAKKIHFKSFPTVRSVLGEMVNESFQEKLAQASLQDEEDRNTEELSDQEEEQDKGSSTMGDFSSETVVVVIEKDEKEMVIGEDCEVDAWKDVDEGREEVSVDEEEEENVKSVVVDLSASETKPLTSYGSGEDEEEGSGDEFLYNNEVEEVSTSMQQDHNAVGDAGTIEVKGN